MNLQNKKIVTLLMGALLFFGGVGVGWFSYKMTKNQLHPFVNYEGTLFLPANSSFGFATTTPYQYIIPNKEEYAGIISSSTEKLNLYTNKRYGFQLNYPTKYEVGDNQLGYDENGNKESGEFWISDPLRAMNYGTINIDILPFQEYVAMEDAKKAIKMKKQVVVSGQPAMVFDLEYRSETHTDRLFIYIIRLPSFLDKYLRIQLYDNPSNFHVLDEMVKTIKWLPVEGK